MQMSIPLRKHNEWHRRLSASQPATKFRVVSISAAIRARFVTARLLHNIVTHGAANQTENVHKFTRRSITRVASCARKPNVK